ncbi:MAG: trypsin-like serine protease with C-terminal domain, partial [Actinomycetia bacterium]|nr:trypsin-like serine protease with C-terminal domain [Actinomycetes bacterium]
PIDASDPEQSDEEPLETLETPPPPAFSPWSDVGAGSFTSEAAGQNAPAAEPPYAATERTEPPYAATERMDPPVPSAAWTPAPPPRGRSDAGDGGGRTGLGGKAAAIAAAAALIGALVGGGIVAATDNNGGTKTIIEQSGGTAPSRPASVISSPGDIQSILQKVKPAVVRVNVTVNSSGFGGGSGQGVGTGFIVSSDGRIVTNAHVVADATSVTVKLADGQDLKGRVLGASTASDLAVVKVNAKNLPTVQLGNSDALQVGDQVVAIGNALGIEGAPTVTSGIVSGLNRVLQEPGTNANPNGVDIPNTIQTDAAINPGNSGGPLLDANGNVIGINTAIADPSQSNNIGFAIAINEAKPAITSLSQGKQPRLAFLGVGTTPLTSALVSRQHLSVHQGAYVANVSNNSAADRGGIKVGDVIVKINGNAVTSDEDVINAVRRLTPGTTVAITVNRKGAEKTFTVTLGSKPTA